MSITGVRIDATLYKEAQSIARDMGMSTKKILDIFIECGIEEYRRQEGIKLPYRHAQRYCDAGGEPILRPLHTSTDI